MNSGPSLGVDDSERLLASVSRLIGAAVPAEAADSDRSSLTPAQSLRVSSHLSALLGVDIRASDVPAASSLRRLIKFALELAQSPEAARRADRDPGSSAPLSHAQARLFLAEQLLPGAADANAVGAYVIHAPLDPAALQTAFGDVLARHSALRTVYGWDEEGAPTQQALAPGECIALEVEAPMGPGDEPQLVAERTCADWWAKPVDLELTPPVRARAVPLDNDRHLICFSIHHISFDGWSSWVLSRDIATAYTARARGRAPEWEPIPSYRGYVWWERDQLARWESADLPFWREVLAVPAPPILPASLTALEAPAHERTVALDEPMTAAVFGGGQRTRTIPLSVLMDSVAEALDRRFGSPRICLGTISSGRLDREFHSVIGCFVNPVAVPVELEGGRTRGERLAHMTDSLLGALSHSRTPFDELVRVLQPADRRAPWFQVLVLLHRGPIPRLDVAAQVKVTPVNVRAPRTSVDLIVEAMPALSGGWQLTARWRSDRLDDDAGESLLSGVVASLLASMEHT